MEQSIIANVRDMVLKAAGEYVGSNFKTKKLGKKKTAKLVQDSVKIFDSSAAKNFAEYLNALKIQQNVPYQPQITLVNFPEVFANPPTLQKGDFSNMFWKNVFDCHSVRSMDNSISFSISCIVHNRSDE